VENAGHKNSVDVLIDQNVPKFFRSLARVGGQIGVVQESRRSNTANRSRSGAIPHFGP